MTEEHKPDLAGFLRDSSLAIACLTALSYYSGYRTIAWYWHCLGLDCTLKPYASVEEILLRGGMVLFATAFPVFGIYTLRRVLMKRKPDPESAKLHYIKQMQKVIFCVLAIFIFLEFNCFLIAWGQSRTFRKEMVRVESITLASNEMIVNPTEFAFLGRMGTYLIFRRFDGSKTGETMLIADSDVKRLTLR